MASVNHHILLNLKLTITFIHLSLPKYDASLNLIINSKVN